MRAHAHHRAAWCTAQSMAVTAAALRWPATIAAAAGHCRGTFAIAAIACSAPLLRPWQARCTHCPRIACGCPHRGPTWQSAAIGGIAAQNLASWPLQARAAIAHQPQLIANTATPCTPMAAIARLCRHRGPSPALLAATSTAAHNEPWRVDSGHCWPQRVIAGHSGHGRPPRVTASHGVMAVHSGS